MDLSEVREYQYGDDYRLEGNSALQSSYVKVYEEERVTVMVIIDVSRVLHLVLLYDKTRLVAKCGYFGFSAMLNNDKIGVIFFQKSRKFIPPRKEANIFFIRKF